MQFASTVGNQRSGIGLGCKESGFGGQAIILHSGVAG